MSKLVADADALIKLHKAGVLEALLGWHEVLVPAAVYEEAVVAGKRELYEDAFALEEALEFGGAIIQGSCSEASGLAGASKPSLGAGERDALGVYREGAEAILSDDRAFLGLLEERGVPYLTAASVVVGLARSGRLSVEEAMESLQRMRRYVRGAVYERALEELNELEQRGGE